MGLSVRVTAATGLAGGPAAEAGGRGIQPGAEVGQPGATASPAGRVDPEMVGLFRSRHRAARRHQAQLAQICRHPDPGEVASGLAQQRIWALRQASQRRLKGSDLVMLRRSV